MNLFDFHQDFDCGSMLLPIVWEGDYARYCNKQTIEQNVDDSFGKSVKVGTRWTRFPP